MIKSRYITNVCKCHMNILVQYETTECPMCKLEKDYEDISIEVGILNEKIDELENEGESNRDTITELGSDKSYLEDENIRLQAEIEELEKILDSKKKVLKQALKEILE